MMGRYVLPWFGGGPAVWTNCLLFFQALLLAGYAYAHWLGSRPSLRIQTSIHVTLLAASLLFLPILPRADVWKPASSSDPSGRILLLLTATVGAPYLLLSSTGPLLQRWFALSEPQKSPWRLYALSNFGSFLALFSYPFVLEPYLRLHTQAWIWSALYAVFAALCGWTAWSLGNHNASAAGARSGLRAGSAPDVVDRAVLAGSGDVRLHASAGHHKPDFAGNRGGPVPVGRAALDLPAHIHSRLRTSALVPARAIRRWSRRLRTGSLRRPGCGRRAGRENTTRNLSPRAVYRVHGLPWRTGALASVAALSDSLLSRYRGRGRAGRRVRRADRSQHIYRIHRISRRSGRRVPARIYGMAADRRAEAMDQPQLRGARSTDGAAGWRAHVGSGHGDQQCCGHRQRRGISTASCA